MTVANFELTIGMLMDVGRSPSRSARHGCIYKTEIYNNRTGRFNSSRSKKNPSIYSLVVDTLNFIARIRYIINMVL